MPPRRSAERRRTAARRTHTVVTAVAAVTAVGLVSAAGGCGQVTTGEAPSTTAGEAPSTTAGSGTPRSAAPGSGPPAPGGPGTAGAPAPEPGRDATPGCEILTPPVHRLVTGEGDVEAGSEEVRRLADGVEDNALSAVASRISGLVTQPSVATAAVDEQWSQFRRLCDLD